ncbi:MAG: hypothetical protein WAO98_11025, partial [Alphaproteobacteria bacterium]
PNQQVPPADISFIRRQQKALLRPIHEMRRIATEVLRHIEGDPHLGGPTLLKQTERQVGVSVLFRLPDSPHIIQKFGPVILTDHAVVLRADHRDISPLLDKLFPPQYASPELDSHNPTINAAFKSVGLVERQGLSPDPGAEHTIVVYPRFLGFTAGWIKKVISPITDLEMLEGSRSPRIGTAHSTLYLSATNSLH